jgi:hypothetical protein
MMIYQNGLLRIKKNTTLKNYQLLSNNLGNKNKDLWQLMQEFQKKFYKLRSEEKLESKRN